MISEISKLVAKRGVHDASVLSSRFRTCFSMEDSIEYVHPELSMMGEVLKYISGPVQTMGKCFRMMHVMVCGIFVSCKWSGDIDLFISGAITGRVTELMTGPISISGDSSTLER